MKTLLITANPNIAQYAEESGVSTIFVDMETRGKAARQGHLDTHTAAHTIGDVEALAKVLTESELLVRINPPWEETADEVRSAIDAGADRVMLPMFRRVGEVAQFKALAQETPVTLLVETAAALARLPAILQLLDDNDLVHFGLNDLSLDMQLDFLFEVLGGRLLDGATALCREAGLEFGIGGIGRIGQGSLPADWILGEHVRLGSDWVILSRAFHGRAASLEALKQTIDLKTEIAAIQRVERVWQETPAEALLSNHARLSSKAAELAKEKK
ncbi:MAG: aldolase/citrate lyase family protein [Burkholderiaceae bacterium]